MISEVFLTIICVLLFVEWLFNWRWRARFVKRIPGPTGHFIIGNTLELIGLSPKDIFNHYRRLASEYNGFFREWMFPFAVFNVYNPQDVETILSSPTMINKSVIYGFLKPWLGIGLLISKGEKWVTRRKILTPAFHFSILRYFATVLEDNSIRLINEISKTKKQETLDVVPLMSNVTLNSICETSMGAKLDEFSSAESKRYKDAIHRMGQLLVYRISKTLWLQPDCVFNATKQGRQQKKVLEVIKNFPKQIIKQRRQDIEKNGFELPVDSENDDICFKNKKMAMLDLLLNAERQGLIDDNGIQEEVDTFMFEGHDTSAMGLIYALLELANNKDIQDKVFEEQQHLFGDFSRPLTMAELSQFKYLECVIKETLRLYPPVPMISRNISEGFSLSGYRVPKGMTEVHLHIFDLHRNPDIYPDPLAFKPERFNPENCANRHPYAYIPFSAGPRNCIGQKFAMLEMKSVLAHVVRKFELRPVTLRSELEFTSDLVLRTTHPVKVQFVKRKESRTI